MSATFGWPLFAKSIGEKLQIVCDLGAAISSHTAPSTKKKLLLLLLLDCYFYITAILRRESLTDDLHAALGNKEIDP